MLVRRTYKFRLYPNREQRTLLEKHFGCCRFVYNHFLRVRTSHAEATGENLPYSQMAKLLTELKRSEDHTWLREINAQSLQQALSDLDKAYVAFYRGNAPFPSLRRRRGMQSFRVPQFFVLASRHLIIPKVSPIRVKAHRPVEGVIKNVLVSRDPLHRYHVTLLCEGAVPDPQQLGGVTALHVEGTEATTSEGVVLDAGMEPSKQLRRLRRRVDRRKPGSKNRRKAWLRWWKLRDRSRNQRNDCIHKLTRKLALENQEVWLTETESEWGQTLAYKGAWYGCRVRMPDLPFPIERRCHACGWIVTRAERKWTCPYCGEEHDRGWNAAQNLLRMGTAGAAGT